MSSNPHKWSLSFFSETIFNLSIPWEVRDGKVGRSRCLVFSNMSKSHKVECEQTHGLEVWWWALFRNHCYSGMHLYKWILEYSYSVLLLLEGGSFAICSKSEEYHGLVLLLSLSLSLSPLSLSLHLSLSLSLISLSLSLSLSLSIYIYNIYIYIYIYIYTVYMYRLYRYTWIWRTTVRRIFAYDGRYAWSQSHA